MMSIAFEGWIIDGCGYTGDGWWIHEDDDTYTYYCPGCKTTKKNVEIDDRP